MAKKTTVSTATFTTGTSGGVQKGTGNIVLLSTGTSDNTTACAIELFLDFTGRNAGTLSFDWATVFNSTGDRSDSIRVYTSTDGTTYTELTGAAVLNKANNVTASGSISSVSLPSSFNGSSTARIRFYNYNGAGGTTGSRAKISIDNVVVTSTAQSSAPTVSSTAASGIGATAATVGGNVTADGGASVTDRGVVYKTSSSVTISDNKTAASTPTGTGSYSIDLSSLSVNQQYYFRAYAINSAGTTLGSELNFTTLANVPSAPTVANPGQSTLDVTVNVNGNPPSTTFAIQADTNNDGTYDGYVQSDGSISASAIWQTAGIWGTKTVTGLSAGQTVAFKVKARNSENTETAFSSAATGTTSASCDAPTATTPTASPSATVCAGTSITLTANRTGGTSPFNYQWKKNGSTIDGAVNNTYVVSSPVNGDIYTCDISAQCGGSASTSPGLTLTVNALPDSTITAPASVCASSVGNSASVPDAGGGATYSWSISGGSITAGSGTRTITFTANASGSVTLNCTVTASTTCSSGGSQNKSVTITALPTAYNVTGGSAGCSAAGLTIGLSGSQSGVNYQLYKDAVATGSPVAGTGSAISFGSQSAVGIYTVVATSASSGCTANMTGSATVNASPTAYSVTGGSGCSGLTVGLSGSQSGVNYQLYRDAASVGSPVAGTGSAISFGSQATAGSYTVLATATSSGCTANQTGSATVYPIPTVTVNSPSTCNGGSATVTATPATGQVPYNYAWTVPNGVSDPGNVASFSSSVAGTYSVVVTDNRGCVSASGSGTLTVNNFSLPGPSSTVFSENMGTPSGTTAISANTFQNATLTFTGTGDVRNNTTSSGYTGASAGGNVFITSTAGTYFQIAGIDSTAYSGMYITFGINKNTTAGNGSDLAVEVSSDGSSYTALSFTNLPTGSGTAIWYQRTATGTIPATANLRIRFRQTGSTTQYRIDDVKLVGSSSSVTEATITPSGSTTICSGNSITLAASPNGSSYAWSVPAGASNPGNSANCTASVAGTYTVTITDANGCTDSDSQTLTTAATPSITLGTSPTVCAGTTSANLPYTATTGSPDTYTIDFNAAANTAGFVDITTPTALGDSPIALIVPAGAAAGTYTGTLTVYNSVSGCGSVGSTFTVTLAGAPAQPGTITQGNPSGSSVCAGASGVTYTISAVSTATSYNWTVPDGASITAGSGTTSITVDWGAVAAGSQNVTVSAVNSCDVGTSRTTAFTLTAGTPAAPTASAGSNVAPTSFNLNWTAVSGVTGYKLDLSTSEDFSDGMVLDNYDIPSQSTVTYLKTGLTSGMTYYYRVRAYNVCGSGDNSATITVNTPLILAGWDMNPLTGGLNSYGASPLSATVVASGVTVGGLTRGSGVTQVGTSAARGWGGTGWNYATAGDAVSANRFATFTIKANSGYSLSINNVSKFYYRRSSTGASAGSLQYSLNGGVFVDLATLDYSSTVSSGAALSGIPLDLSGVSALQGLASDVTVTFRIVNYGASASDGTWYLYDNLNTTENDFEIRGTLCSIPTVYSVTGGGAYCSGGSGVSVGLSGSQAGITYQLYRNGGLTSVGAPVTGTGSAISFGLQTVADTYTVVATRISGDCTATMSGNATVTVTVPPSAPATIFSTQGVSRVGLGWTVPAGTVSGYNLKRATVSGGPYSAVTGGSGLTGTTFTDTTVEPDVTYYYVVSALNDGCEGADSSQTAATPTGDPPNAPTIQAATQVNTTSFQANWSTTPNTGHYHLDVSTDNFSTFVPGYDDLVVNNNYKSVTALTPGQTYSYRVRADNTAGVSENSGTTTVTLPVTSTVVIDSIPATVGSTNLTWAATIGAKYDIYYSDSDPAGSMSWSKFGSTITANADPMSATVTENNKRFFKVVIAGATPAASVDAQVWGVIKPAVPAGFSMMSAPLALSDLSLNGELGDALKAALPLGSKIHVLNDGGGFSSYERVDSGNGWGPDPGSLTLAEGQGFFVENADPGTVYPRFTGPVGNNGTATRSISHGATASSGAWNILGVSQGKSLPFAQAFATANFTGTPTANWNQNRADVIAVDTGGGVFQRAFRAGDGTWVLAANPTQSPTWVIGPGTAVYYFHYGNVALSIRF